MIFEPLFNSPVQVYKVEKCVLREYSTDVQCVKPLGLEGIDKNVKDIGAHLNVVFSFFVVKICGLIEVFTNPAAHSFGADWGEVMIVNTELTKGVHDLMHKGGQCHTGRRAGIAVWRVGVVFDGRVSTEGVVDASPGMLQEGSTVKQINIKDKILILMIISAWFGMGNCQRKQNQ
jgi:hypothetical protein